MTSKFPKLAGLLLLASAFSIQSAFAWSDLGHMAVAYIAYQKLSPTAKERVNQLTKLNPFCEAWKAEIRESGAKIDTDTALFMLSATFPDLIKTDSRYESDGSEKGNSPDDPRAAQNIGFADHLTHKYWHYYDLPFSQDKAQLFTPPAPNALTQIATMRKTLASDASDDVKSYDLCWLTHIVGDVHQPLHCTTRVSKNSLHGDNGGNDVSILYSPSKYKYQTFYEGMKPQIRLHWFWDSCLGNTGLSHTLRVATQLQNANAKMANDLNENDWIKESFDLAKKKLYSSPIGSGNGPFLMTPKYEQAAIKISRERVALAGERLAKILNKELK